MTATLPAPSARAELSRIDTKAACGTGRYDPELWHSVLAEEVDEAKSICLIQCPVMDRCRAWALASGQDHGVWGGLSALDRKKLAKAPQATRVECPAGHPQTVDNVLANGRCRPCTSKWNANSRTRYGKSVRFECVECCRPIGLDRAGRFTKHLDLTTHTTCPGSWKTPAKEKA